MKFLMPWAIALLFWIAASTDVLAQSTETTLTLKVKGVTCANDLTMIQDNVNRLGGVSSCEIGKQGPTTRLAISYDPNVVTEKELRAAIEDTPACGSPDERPYKVK